MTSNTQNNIFITFLINVARVFYDIAALEYDEMDEDGLINNIR